MGCCVGPGLCVFSMVCNSQPPFRRHPCDQTAEFYSLGAMLGVLLNAPQGSLPPVDRRVVAMLAASCLCSAPCLPAAGAVEETVLHLPLQQTPGGVLTTGVFIDGEPFQVIIDTGSPYLVVPLEDSCNAQPAKQSFYGCASPGQFVRAGFPSTSEQYGAVPGKMEWLAGELSFGETDLRMESDGSLSLLLRYRDLGAKLGRRRTATVFGGADRRVLSQSGGALLGLIRNVNRLPQSTIPRSDLRPTVLEQLGLCAFRLDAPAATLTLSSAALISPSADALPLVDPRDEGDGVEHMCCRVAGDQLVLDGIARRASRPVYCVFDSGLTGIVLSQSLVDDLGVATQVTSTPPYSLAEAREQQGKGSEHGSSGGLPATTRSLELALLTEGGSRTVLRSSAASSPLFYVQSIPLNWFADAERGPHVVAIGHCVLGQGALTVDVIQRRALWELPGAEQPAVLRREH